MLNCFKRKLGSVLNNGSNEAFLKPTLKTPPQSREFSRHLFLSGTFRSNHTKTPSRARATIWNTLLGASQTQSFPGLGTGFAKMASRTPYGQETRRIV
jgi:hypothetical protein